MINQNRTVRICLLVCATVVIFGMDADAQYERVNTGSLTAGATANYRFAEAGELSIAVTLLGPVQRPGRYELSHRIDLLNLLALAGGWSETADMANVSISRLASASDPGSRFHVQLDLEDVEDVSPKFLELQDGDIIVVGKATPVTIPMVLSIVGTAATVAIAIGWYNR